MPRVKRARPQEWDSSMVLRLARTRSGRTLSTRQLQYWDETGLVRVGTREKRRKRLYCYEDILRLRIIGHLLEAGLPVQKIRAAIVNIEAASAGMGRPWHTLKIVTDGVSVFLVDGDRALDALKNQVVSLVLLGDIEEEAKRACAGRPNRSHIGRPARQRRTQS